MGEVARCERCEIVEATTRFGWLLDRGKWVELERVFSPQVEIDYTSLHGGEPYWGPARPKIDEWRGHWERADAMQHLIANQQVTRIAADFAFCTANCIATVASTGPDGAGAVWSVGGTYRFELIRETGSWLISRVLMKVLWQTGSQPD
jgi:SnoaL-like domain